MKNNIAFTFVEIVVVITIIAIISTTSSFYFFDFIRKKELGFDITNFESTLQQLDYNIKKQEIFDYEVTLSHQNYFQISTDNIGIENRQVITFDSDTKQARLFLNPNGNLPWEIKIYKDHKKTIHTFIDGAEDYFFQIEHIYHIESIYNENNLNKITLDFFEREKRNPDKLTEIIHIVDSTNTVVQNLVIQNLGGNKRYINGSNNTILTTPISIVFDKKGTEKTLHLK
ncbi:MAG: hypothetical protein GY828_07710 [Candidatus Gracilibacteria bacterium]|nr:hypothetical protein [Candidatus Gracilibacteria bacterium]